MSRDRYADPPRLPEGDVALDSLVRGPGELELEIGPGRGGFILERCATSDARIVGLEIRRKWACVIDERLAARGYGERARVFCEDARQALPRIVPDGCLARVFVHFPDPWWKKRHQKRLVIVDTFVAQLARLLRDDGELFVQTDVPERADEYAERIAGAELVPAGIRGAHIDDSPFEARSNRERRAMQDGLPVRRLLFRRQPR